MKWTYQTQPTIEPVSYADMKDQLRIDSDDERGLITNYIVAARIYAETETQMTLIQRQVLLERYSTEPPVPWVPLPRGPVVSIDNVVDENNVTIDPSRYALRRIGTVDYLYWINMVWPANVTYTTGFGDDATDVPQDIRTAIMLHVTHLWENRSATTDKQMNHVEFGLDIIYGQYKARGIIG